MLIKVIYTLFEYLLQNGYNFQSGTFRDTLLSKLILYCLNIDQFSFDVNQGSFYI